MAYSSFRHFLETLERAGELKRVAEPVDTNLVISEWADREMKSHDGGSALLFEQPIVDRKTSKFPVAINTMGSRKRMAMALGRESVDETRFQFVHQTSADDANNTIPTIQVSDAFTGGGSQIGLASNIQNRWELNNTTSLSLGNHAVKFGMRLRDVHIRSTE